MTADAYTPESPTPIRAADSVGPRDVLRSIRRLALSLALGIGAGVLITALAFGLSDGAYFLGVAAAVVLLVVIDSARATIAMRRETVAVTERSVELWRGGLLASVGRSPHVRVGALHDPWRSGVVEPSLWITDGRNTIFLDGRTWSVERQQMVLGHLSLSWPQVQRQAPAEVRELVRSARWRVFDWSAWAIELVVFAGVFVGGLALVELLT